ncbi:MAG: hypothetical protein QOI55_1017, partial [Actinomycetota bacterium]|nr:hypothetical protein [Actinomycetota bacterium]
MTTLDERARHAANALQEAVAAQQVVVMEERPRRPRRSSLLVAAAVVALIAIVVTALGRDTQTPVADAPRIVRTMTVPAESKRIAVSPAGVWVLSACGAESSPLHCNQLQLVGPARSQSRVVKRTLPDGVDKALAYAAGSLWAAGGGEGRVSIGTVMRIQPGRLSIEKTWSFTDVTPTDIVEAYGDVWVLDRQRNRVLRIDPATNRVKYVELRTEGLGLVSADRMVVANGAVVIVSRCCGTSRGYSQLGTVNKDGLFTTFFSTIGQLTVAPDGSNLWVGTRKGSLTRYRASGVMRHSASWFVDL